MSLRWKLTGAVVALAALLPGFAPSRAPDALATAREQFKAANWQAVVTTLQDHLRFEIADADTDDLLGQALAKLGRKDEAAHHFDRALASIAPDDKRVGPLRKRLAEADPLTQRRDALFKKVARELFQAAEQLEQSGNRERALDVLERIRLVASGPEREKIGALADRIRSTTEQVDLDQAAGARPEEGWPELTHESKRYIFQAHLEPEVAELLGQTMDEIFEYYVKIYFDGDEKGVSDRKPKIFIHASHAKLMERWQGPKDFIPGGWWSPGEWVVHAYDTRPDQGSLDEMLNTLFHEASHHFMTLIDKGSGAPKWLNEGTASFFEGATAMADGTVLWPDAKTRYLGNLVEMLRGERTEGRLPTMTGVIQSESEYPGEYYAWGWGLVYYLQQYEDPLTLEYVYRPLYVAYRDEVIQKGTEPLTLFSRLLLGKNSPRKHATIEDYERDWRSWIQDTVHPLHFGQNRRALRMAAVDRYLAAAKAAAGAKKAKVGEPELLQRALGHLDFVRTKIDKPEEPDPALLSLQADIFEKLGRGGAAAPLIEQLLDLAAEGKWKVDDARVLELEQRLSKLDAKNSPLRVAQARAKTLARAAAQVLADYEAKQSMTLRSYTFASLAANALDDKQELASNSQRLRTLARDAGLLHGAMYKLAGPSGTWKTIFTNQETEFEHSDRRVMIEAVRPVGRLCTAVPITGEYELRARITRVGEPRISASHGVVVSGTAGGDWIVATIDHVGLRLKRMNLGVGGGVTDKSFDFVALKQKPPVDQPFELTVHVFPEGNIEVTVNGEGPYPFKLPLALPAVGHAGVYVKDGRCIVEDALIEILP